MALPKYLAVFLIATACLSQELDQTRAIVYPRLAEFAHIQGVVHLRLTTERVLVISNKGEICPRANQPLDCGHPLLADPATEHFKIVSASKPSGFEADYFFVLLPNSIAEAPKKLGNPALRFLARIFGRPTNMVIADKSCKEPEPRNNSIDLLAMPIAIHVYGVARCAIIN